MLGAGQAEEKKVWSLEHEMTISRRRASYRAGTKRRKKVRESAVADQLKRPPGPSGNALPIAFSAPRSTQKLVAAPKNTSLADCRECLQFSRASLANVFSSFFFALLRVQGRIPGGVGDYGGRASK